MHTQPIPRLGGLAIFLGFLITVVLFADITREVQGILLGSVVIVIIGVIDDIVPLPALVKFFVQVIAALIAVFHGVVITIVSNPAIWSASDYLVFGYFSIPATVLWIVAITNSVNLIDGLDGLAAGAIGYVFGRSRRGSFVAAVLGMMGADIWQAAELWNAGIAQALPLGGAGALDMIVIAGLTAVLLSELVGELIERMSRGTRRDHRREFVDGEFVEKEKGRERP